MSCPLGAPTIEPFPAWIPPLVQDRLELVGVRGLYPHQAAGLEVLADGRHLVMSTGTASGKTLVYNLAFAAEAVERPTSTALYLFPTKALARDQLRAVRALTIPQMKAAVYDGDTPRAERPLIRKNANLVMTNPDMLHLALLADHARWADFFFRLSLIVVDEAHVCRGVFGSHVAMTLRRLRRLVAHYGGTPRWMLASATIGNPGELATRLTGLTFDEVVADAAPSGEKLFALWNPPIIDDDTGARRSALTEASWLMSKLVQEDIRTIGFTRSRRAAELLAEFARRDVGDAQKRARIKSYRAGYLAEDRRTIERELANGELLAIASTNALELGIDIGSLDAAVLTGYPGTRASMWQQAGRSGQAGLGLARDPGGPGRSARPVPRAPSGGPVRQAARGGGDRPHEPVRPGAAPPLRGAGAAAARRGPRLLRRRGRRRSRGRAHDRARGAGAAQGHLERSRTGVAPPLGGYPGGRRTHLLDRDRRDG